MLSAPCSQHVLFDPNMIVRDYNPVMDYNDIFASHSGIKIISEGIDDSPAFEFARGLIRNAEIVFMLGFGFHEDNMRRLGLDRKRNIERPTRDMVLGTRKGLTDAQKEFYEEMYWVRLGGQKETTAFEYLNDQITFLRE